MLSRIAETNVTYAVQYLVAGRFAVAASLTPVAGNLLHHAIEMALKAGLEKANVKTTWRHELPVGWKLFQETYRQIPGYDQAIEDLQKFEDIRYPDQIERTLLISIGYKREIDPIITHQIALDEIDRLFDDICVAASINWRVFLGLREEVRKYAPPVEL